MKLVKSDYIKLVPILALAFYLAYIPHLNYPYALHIDEWTHIVHSNALLHENGIFYTDPFSGQGSGDIISRLELGYHLPLAIFQRISGVSWINIARYFPSIIFVFIIQSVYIFAKKLGFGWEAAFFTSLVPTTVGILGPALLVPVAMAFAFVPIILLLVFNFKTFWSYLTVSIIFSFLIILHAASAILVITIVIPFVILSLKRDFKHGLFITIALAFPFLITLPWTFSLIMSQFQTIFVQKSLPPYHDFLNIITGYGYFPIIFCLIGVLFLTIKTNREKYGLVLGLVILLMMLAGFYSLHYGISLLYLRGLLFAMLMMSIVAGAGLMAIRKLTMWLIDLKSKNHFIAHLGSILVCLIVVVITLAVAIPDRLATPYYHMIDKTDYETFAWIKDNISSNNKKALVDPWKATAFTAITGKYVYSRIVNNPTAKDEAAYEFIRNGGVDSEFLRENGVSIVYARINAIEYSINNPDLVEVRKNVYILK